ncbi:MAG: efflux RND transporter periplasmic adaptor subunit [Deltaproteobacteria bacterium]|nr:efflux RND transporter periplasmic adaptor subunit [Deltaproteobacteria bacterium]
MKKRKGMLSLAIVLAGGIIFYYWQFHSRETSGSTIQVSGNIEATTIDVAFKISGKIDKRLVDEGDIVKEGQLIATQEHKDLLAQKAKAEATLETARSRLPALEKNIDYQDQATTQEISQAQAAVENAQARLQQLLDGSRPQEIQSAKAGVDQALADMEKKKADMDRAKKLYQDKYIAAQDWDAAKTAYDMAVANYKKAQENYDLVVEGPRKEEIAAGRAQLEQSQAALRLAKTHRIQIDVLKKELATARGQVKEAASALEVIQTQIEYSNLYAPTSGVVLVKNAEPGEFVVPGGAVVTLGQIEKPWLKAFINESDLGRVKLGQKVSVTTDTYPGKEYPGKVTFISSEAEFTPKNVQTAKERVKLVYRIKVGLENPQNELKPGMPADAQIQIK